MQGQISAGGLIVGGMIGQRGAPGNGIVSITYKSSSGLEDTYEVLYTNGETDDIVVTNGAEGNGISSITKTSSVGLVDTYTILYTNGSSDTIEVHNGEKGDKGDTGATGATPNLTIGNVTKGADASATITGTTDNPVLNLVLPKGDKGDKGDTGNTGATGNGIYSVTKTGTAELVDTYTILYTNGETTTFTITNGAKGDTGATGNGISTITKTGTAGLVDTYTITYTNGNTDTFEVTNGANGSVTDVQVEGTSVVDNGVANIVGLATQEELDRYKTIYNVLPKVSGNGESITLDNTGESILKLNPKGQCKQDSTTGYALYDFMNNAYTTEGTLSITKLENGYAITNNYSTPLAYRMMFAGISLDSSKNYVISFDLVNTSGGTTRVGWVGSSKYIDAIATGHYAQSFTGITSTAFSIYPSPSATITITNLMFYEGTDLTKTYEPYTGGIASPNPSYPQEIHEASGDNKINVEGKNLLDEEYYKNATYGSNVYKYTSLKFKGNRTLYFKTILKSGKTSISGLYLAVSNKNNPNLTGNKSYFLISNGTINPTASNYFDFTGEEDLYLDYYPTSVTPQDIFDAYNIIVSLENADYEPYNGDTYELDLGVKNLAKPTFDSNFYITGSGDNRKVASRVNDNCGEVIEVKPNTNYTISGTFTDFADSVIRIALFDTMPVVDSAPTNHYNTGSSTTFTTGANTHYVLLYDLRARSVTVNDIQLEEGTKKNSFSPYGQTPIKMRGIGTYEDYFVRNSDGQWCKYNAIGEVVLDGSENWTYVNSSFRHNVANLNTTGNDVIKQVSNYFKAITYSSIWSNYDYFVCYTLDGNVVLKNKDITNINDFKTWLSTHNTEVQYVLATPYLSLIENETLISQLDAIEKALAKSGQTNISQVNNDAPFKIYASALMKISGE